MDLTSEENVEIAARAVYEYDDVAPKPHYWSHCTPDMVAWYRDAGRAALVAVFDYLKENQNG